MLSNISLLFISTDYKMYTIKLKQVNNSVGI